jgi:hypothetical protein
MTCLLDLLVSTAQMFAKVRRATQISDPRSIALIEGPAVINVLSYAGLEKHNSKPLGHEYVAAYVFLVIAILMG